MTKIKDFFKKLWFYVTCGFWWVVWKGKHRAGMLDLGKDIRVEGTVLWSDFGQNPDGDFTFHLKLDPPYIWTITTFGGELTSADHQSFPATLHCETTPWDRPKMADVLAQLKVGSKVVVEGRWTYDGVHTGKPEWLEILYAIWGHGPNMKSPSEGGGWFEIHPIKSIKILNG